MSALMGSALTCEAQIHQVEDVVWKDVVNTSGVPGALIRTGATSTTPSWDADAVSVKNIIGDGWVEFSFRDPSQPAVLGLSAGNTDRGINSLEYSIRCLGGAAPLVSVREKSVDRTMLAGADRTVSETDIFRIERTGGIIRYYKNKGKPGESLLYVSLVPSQSPLLVDTSLVYKGTGFQNVKYYGPEGPEDLVWAKPGGATPSYLTGGSGSRLAKSKATVSFDSGAVSYKAIQADGYAQFRFGQVNGDVVVGFAGTSSEFGVSTYSNASLIHTIRGRPDKKYEVQESGVSRWVSTTPYTLDDVFRIERSAETVRCLRNGAVFYTFSAPSSGALLVGASILTNGASVTNCQYDGVQMASPVAWTRLSSTVAKHAPGGSSIEMIQSSPSQVGDGIGYPIVSETGFPVPEVGLLSFKFGQTNKTVALGLSAGVGSPSLYGIKGSAGVCSIIEYDLFGKPVLDYAIGPYSTADHFGIRCVNGRVDYLRNGQLLRSVVPSRDNFPVVIDAFFGVRQEGARITDCEYYGGPEDLIWTRQVGATPVVQLSANGSPGRGSRITRSSAAAAWSADAVSSRQIVGDGYVQFRFGNTDKRAMIGFSVSDTNESYSELTYALYGNKGVLNIFENGVPVINPSTGNTSFGVYTITDTNREGDLFKIVRKNGVVSFWKMPTIGMPSLSQPLYISSIITRTPLLVDCSLYDPGVSLVDCQYWRRDTDSDGMDDEWEMATFGHLDRKGGGDYDMDGVTDREEFLGAGNPRNAVVDTDGDGLPDQWEIAWFGSLQRTPIEDEDRDGLTILDEYEHESDPFDRFNSQTPQLRITGGNGQVGAFNSFLRDPLVVEVRGPGGEVLPNAPVFFTVVAGDGTLHQGTAGEAYSSLTLLTDENGRATVFFKLPLAKTVIGKVRAGAWSRTGGYQTVEFSAYPVGSDAELVLSGLNVWLKADTGLELSGNAVTTWYDLSGWNFTATLFNGAAGSTAPTVGSIGAIPLVNFDGIDDRLSLPTEIGSDNFTIFSVVASTSTTTSSVAGTSYQYRAAGASGQRYLFGGPLPTGVSPWPTVPQKPSKRRISQWTNNLYIEDPFGRLYVPLQGNENVYPVATQYLPVDKRYDVTGNVYWDGSTFVRNPQGGWSADKCVADYLSKTSVFNGWATSRTTVGTVRYMDGGLELWKETFYDITPTTWSGLTNSTQPNQSVLAHVSAGLSTGSDGVAAFEMRSDYSPATAVSRRTADQALRVITLKYEGKRPRLYDNGLLKASGPVSLAGSVRGPQYIGSAGISGSYFKGGVAEILIFNRALSEMEREAVENYLAERFKIAGVDRDGDQLPDWFEYQWFGDLDETGAGDTDGDGLTNIKEHALGLNPANVDTDQDGLWDGYEILYENNKTNPAMADTDGDGYPDGYEKAQGWNPLNSSNGLRDANGDGVHDGWAFLLNYNAATADSDGDGLRDLDEIRIGSDPYRSADSNGDGISDRVAWLSGVNAFQMDHDGDGVSNSEEVIRGTDPFRADSDGDGVNDLLDAFPIDPARNSMGAANPNDKLPPNIVVVRPPDAQRIR
ncbi:MAG: hypothetical protein RL630_1275 [Verrucomicrobiota bacterium]